MSESQMQILWSKKQTIDLGRVGQLSGLHQSLTSLDLRTLHDTMAAFAVAQALLQGIGGGQTETGLSVRALIVSQDFTDATTSSDLSIVSNDWIQPSGTTVAGSGTGAGYQWYPTSDGSDSALTPIYSTSKLSKNDMKIIILYGLRAVGVGNVHSGTIVKSNQWQFWRRNVKLIDRWYVEMLNSAPENFVCAITPIMYKKDDFGLIMVKPNSSIPSDINKIDRLQLLGVVVETVGSNSVG